MVSLVGIIQSCPVSSVGKSGALVMRRSSVRSRYGAFLFSFHPKNLAITKRFRSGVLWYKLAEDVMVLFHDSRLIETG